MPRGRLYDRASLAEERRRLNVGRQAVGGPEAVEAPTDPQASHRSLTKKTAAQDEGKAFDTGLVTNFAKSEGGLFQTRWNSFKCIRATVTNHFALVSKKSLVGRIPEI
jgi:hypothetical protein